MSTVRGTDVYVALKEQVDLTTPASDLSLETGDYLAFESEAMQGSRQTVNSRAIRRSAVRKRAFSANGTIAAGGSLEFTGSQLILEKLLPLATHTNSTVTWYTRDEGTGVETPVADPNNPPAGAYPRVKMAPTSLARTGEAAQGIRRSRYTLQDGGRLQPFTTFIGMTGGTASEGNYTRKFVGCKVGTFALSSKVNEFLKISTDIQGVRKELGDGTRTPTYPGDEVEYSYLFDGASVKIKAGNMATLGELPVSAFDLELNHNVNTDDYRLGAIERQSLDEGVTDITGSFEMSAGAGSLTGSHLNANSGLYNDRAFLERLNLEAKYASLQVQFSDWTRPLTESGVAPTGSTRTKLVLNDEPVSIKPGDSLQVGEQSRVRVETVDLATKTLTLSGTGLGADPVPGDAVKIPSHLRVTLPYVRLEEPDFNVRDENTLRGTCRFTGYDGVTFDHVCKI